MFHGQWPQFHPHLSVSSLHLHPSQRATRCMVLLQHFCILRVQIKSAKDAAQLHLATTRLHVLPLPCSSWVVQDYIPLVGKTFELASETSIMLY